MLHVTMRRVATLNFIYGPLTPANTVYIIVVYTIIIILLFILYEPCDTIFSKLSVQILQLFRNIHLK